ncbi:MAG TPA: porin family protein [Flavobacterium sp.]|nr:porin family protein [Flavobacterium sp.]
MKKTILLLVCVTAGFFANAQKDKREEGIKIGIKGGLNVSNFAGGDIEDNAIRTSIHAGFVAEFIVSDHFSVQPELLYSGQGFSNQNPGNFSRAKFDYILLPVLAKYYVAKNLSIETGPQLGFLLSAKNKTNDANDTVDEQSKVDFGLDLGLGYELKNGVFFQGRYNLGITNVNDNSDSESIKYTNSVFQVSVGILF